jgi:hypothetical protein
VRIYAGDAVLLDEVAALFRGSLSEGRSIAAIMTSSHRNGLERRLLAQGVDMGEAKQNGRLCMLDADQALNEFVEPAGPSRELFLSQFGKILRTLKAATVAKVSGVVVFGEMAAVLWAQKNYEAALRLEELLDELAQTSSFCLCCAYPGCAYPANAFRGGLILFPYAEICAQHSHVVSVFEGLRRTASFGR